MLALVGNVAAYSPAAAVMTPMRAARSSSPVMGVSDLVGVSTETGGKVWDPLGLSDNMDEQNLKLIRAAEVRRARPSAWNACGMAACPSCRSVHAPDARSGVRRGVADAVSGASGSRR